MEHKKINSLVLYQLDNILNPHLLKTDGRSMVSGRKEFLKSHTNHNKTKTFLVMLRI